MRNEFTLAFNEVLEEKQLPKEIILKALESALVSAYRRSVNASANQEVNATVDVETGKVTIFAEKEVVEQVVDTRTEVTLEEARRYVADAELGNLVIVESTPRDFGRVAAQTARQVIQQRIRDAERQAQLEFFDKQTGEIVSGIIQAANTQTLTVGLDMKAEGSLPRKELIGNESFKIHDRVRALIAEVKDSPRGPQIILSRTHRNFLRRLLENEVPEIYHGVVEIRSIAREPGERAKVAVSTEQTGIDPVGACVGVHGVRIQAIVKELHNEKIDVIAWNPNAEEFIAKALSPARVSGVYLNEKAVGGKTATVVVAEDQLSLAIGREGQNARLAAKLTGWRIDIKSLPEAAADTISRLTKDASLAQFAETEKEKITLVEEMLIRKSEGRILMPEEYDLMTKFIDRVEKRIILRSQPEKKEEVRPAKAQSTIPASAYEVNLLDSTLKEHVVNILQEAGIITVGELAETMETQPDKVLKLNGIGPNAVNAINALLTSLKPQAEPVVEKISEPEIAAPVAIEEQPVAVIEESAPVVEFKPEAEASMEVAPVTEEVAPVVEEEKEEGTFDTIFAATSISIEPAFEEEEEEGDDKQKKKGGKKKKKQVVVEYDPDRDLTVVTKKHKRGDSGWDWE